MPNKIKPQTVRVSSSEFCNSPGLWYFFERARRTEPKGWCRDFLKAFFRNRMTAASMARLIAGDYDAKIEGEVVIVTTPKAAPAASRVVTIREVTTPAEMHYDYFVHDNRLEKALGCAATRELGKPTKCYQVVSARDVIRENETFAIALRQDRLYVAFHEKARHDFCSPFTVDAAGRIVWLSLRLAAYRPLTRSDMPYDMTHATIQKHGRNPV